MAWRSSHWQQREALLYQQWSSHGMQMMQPAMAGPVEGIAQAMRLLQEQEPAQEYYLLNHLKAS